MDNNTVSQNDSPGRRAAAYWFEDGLTEIYYGLPFLLMGSLGVAHSLLLLKGWAIGNLWMVLLVGVTVGTIGYLLFVKDRQIIDFFKSRLTYPRTGYARPPENPAPGKDDLVDLLTPDQRIADLVTPNTARAASENVTAFKARTVFPFVLASIVAQGAREPGSVAMLMAAVAALVFFLNRREVHSYSILSVLPIALAGLLFAALKVPAKGNVFIPMVIGGGWLSARGVWALIRYLHTHPRRQAVEQVRL